MAKEQRANETAAKAEQEKKRMEEHCAEMEKAKCSAQAEMAAMKEAFEDFEVNKYVMYK